MSDNEVLEELISRAGSIKSKLAKLSDEARVQGGRFVELGHALETGEGLPKAFAFEYCDISEARRTLQLLAALHAELRSLEFRIRRGTPLDLKKKGERRR